MGRTFFTLFSELLKNGLSGGAGLKRKHSEANTMDHLLAASCGGMTTPANSGTPNSSLGGHMGGGQDLSEEERNKKKKVRTTFTGRQIFELEKMFENKKYLSSSERSDMAKLLNVTEQQVREQEPEYIYLYLQDDNDVFKLPVLRNFR